MTMAPESRNQIALPPELIAQTPESVLVFNMQLMTEGQLFRARVAQLEAGNQGPLACIER